MNENHRYTGGAQGDATSPSNDRAASEVRPRSESQSVTKAASEASEAVTAEAKALAEEARQVAQEQAEKVKEATASHMDSFADALRAAGKELSDKQSGPAAELVASAASGLEGLSRSLHGKSTGEMIDTVRRFGRENPIGFLAGSVLAGLALGRFAAAAASPDTSPARSSAPSDKPIAGTGGNSR